MKSDVQMSFVPEFALTVRMNREEAYTVRDLLKVAINNLTITDYEIAVLSQVRMAIDEELKKDAVTA